MQLTPAILVSLSLVNSYAGASPAEQSVKPQFNVSPTSSVQGELGPVGANAAKIAETAKLPPERPPIVSGPKPPSAASIYAKLEMEPLDVPIADGPCLPSWKSLGVHFKCPTWWRQAKIGAWLFSGPMSVGDDGDWYAKWMYKKSQALLP